ncbi:MAG: single-stranded DNA-binding protein [Campylobacterota bacterium]|nr:single-stranded DNA-binding protein [Campylobacterota bacterium]
MYNKLIMIGNLTRDIEIKYLPNGTSIANGAIATSHKYKLQSGEQKEEVCFIDFSVFGKQATILSQYVRKGSKVMLEGRLSFEQWQDQNGGKRSRHTLKVDTFKFLDSKADSANLPPQGNGTYGQQASYNQPPAQQPQYNEQQQYHNTQEQNSYGQQSQSGMQNHQQVQQKPYEEKIPEIDIDNDEIPF